MGSMRGASDVFEALRREFGFSYERNGRDFIMDLPESIGRGRVKTTRVRPGVEVSVFDCVFEEDFCMEVSSAASFLEVNLFLAGGARSRVDGMDGDIQAKPGWSALVLGPEGTRGAMECPAGRRFYSAEVAFSAEAVSPLLGGEGYDLAAFGEGGCEGVRGRVSRTPPSAALALRQIMACPYYEAARRVFIEAKAMELLALHLAEPPEENGEVSLRLDDVERVHAAKDILDASLEDPPSLMELSRRIGLNDFKLKVGFKQIFGTTAFGHLHERRMEEARRLIEGGEMNVGEVAFAVGYASQSRFAAAFKKRYGIRPSSLLPHRNSCRKPIARVRRRGNF